LELFRGSVLKYNLGLFIFCYELRSMSGWIIDDDDDDDDGGGGGVGGSGGGDLQACHA